MIGGFILKVTGHSTKPTLALNLPRKGSFLPPSGHSTLRELIQLSVLRKKSCEVANFWRWISSEISGQIMKNSAIVGLLVDSPHLVNGFFPTSVVTSGRQVQVAEKMMGGTLRNPPD